MKASVDLSLYDNSWFTTNRSLIVRALWHISNILLIKNPFNPFSFIKVFFLRLFGAKIGKGNVIKPSVNIKYPWKLKMGNYNWIGENVWIDNLDMIKIGSNCCFSQGVMLLCGNHNYQSKKFGLITKPIVIEDGVWIGAKSIVIPGTLCKSHSVLAVNSVSPLIMEAYSIYRGNPAFFIKQREIK